MDSENPTGARSVYRRVGFAVESRWTNYLMTVDAPASGAAVAGAGRPLGRGDSVP